MVALRVRCRSGASRSPPARSASGAAESFVDLGGRQHVHTRRGELERERQPLQRAANRGDVAGVLVGELELAVDAPRPRDEDRDRVVASERFECLGFVGSCEWKNVVDLLAPNAQGGSAGDKHTKTRSGVDESCHQLRGFEQAFEIVEHDDRLSISQAGDHRIHGLRPLLFGHAYGRGYGRTHERGVGERRKIDEIAPSESSAPSCAAASTARRVLPIRQRRRASRHASRRHGGARRSRRLRGDGPRAGYEPREAGAASARARAQAMGPGQDGPFQLTQRRARLEPELVGEQQPSCTKDGERVGLLPAR